MSGLDTIIRDRTVAKDISMSGKLVLSKDEWLARGGFYCGSIGRAAKKGLFTVRQCEKMGKPVNAEEFASCRNFAMIKDCDVCYCLNRNDKRVRPCVPVFYRGNDYDKR